MKVLVLNVEYQIESKRYSMDLDIPMTKIRGMKDVELEVENYLTGMFDREDVEIVDITIFHAVEVDRDFLQQDEPIAL